MPVILYQVPPSPPCRAVLMTAEHLGLELEKRFVDILNGEQMKPEFLEMNPTHTVPVIDDNGFYLWDSHVIQAYLCNKYAQDSQLYPRDPKQRANVDKMMLFESGKLSAVIDFARPQLFAGLPPDPEKEETMKKALEMLDKILERTTYTAGNHITIADYSILATLVFVEELLGYKFDGYPNISAWLKKMKQEAPKYKEINEVPLRELLKSKKQ